jgi:hypothetical protein
VANAGTSSGGGGGTTKPADKKTGTTPAAIPTPTPPKADTPECTKYRQAKAASASAAVLATLERKCKSSGGSP